MQSNEILTSVQLDQILEMLNRLDKYINDFYTEIDDAIRLYEKVPVTQSLYASGNFGEGQKEYLQQISSAVKKYYDVLSSGNDSLVAQTKRYISDQKELLARNFVS